MSFPTTLPTNKSENSPLYAAEINEAFNAINILSGYSEGSSTGTGSLQTIPHGLSFIPNVVITPLASGTTVSGVYADATNIYCIVTSGKGFKWKATP
jgi:hypothetical protein